MSVGFGFDLTFCLHRDVRISAARMGLFNELFGFPDQLSGPFQVPFGFSIAVGSVVAPSRERTPRRRK